tara:strand:+ start:151 stop:444 length:294 start_codon:yes stop_codon:yes gene_type:complete
MTSNLQNLMEKVSPQGYVVEFSEYKDDVRSNIKWKDYQIVADSYLELIAGIDSIEEGYLSWYVSPSDVAVGVVSGLPRKYDGKWHARFCWEQYVKSA